MRQSIARQAKTARRGAVRRGTAAVEMAVVATFILCPLTYGMIEMSRAVQVKEALTKVARSGGAVAIRPGADNASVLSAINAALTSYEISPQLATITLKVNGSPANVSTAAQGDQISVSVSVPAASVNFMLPMFLSDASVTSGTLIMMRQGT